MRHGLFLIDKPKGITSHDVVSRVRRLMGQRKVGHAGTLDPMASGLMLVACGEGTKFLRYLTHQNKSYHALLKLGEATDTLDADGLIVEKKPVPNLDATILEGVAHGFKGVGQQQVPMYSAIKIKGRRLYDAARAHEIFEPPTRATHVMGLSLSETTHPDSIWLEAEVGAGCYIRSLGRDIALALGTVGHLSQLRRVSVGPFDVVDALTFDNWDPDRLISMDELASWFPRIQADDTCVQRARQGKVLIDLDSLKRLPQRAHLDGRVARLDEETFVLVDSQNRPIAWVVKSHRINEYKVLRGFATETS